MELKLEQTAEFDNKIHQTWSINHDGSIKKFRTISKPHSVSFDNDAQYNIQVGNETVKLFASQIIGCEIAAYTRCKNDGDTVKIDEDWVKNVESAGVRRDSLGYSAK